MDFVTRDNARAYNERAREWDETMSGNVGHIYLEKPAMARLIPADLEWKDILCIGAGAGDELAELIRQNPRRVVAIDISEKLLERAKAKFPSIETAVMDMRELSFPDQSFDFVYSSLAFHYAADWDQLLAGVFRMLRPGGKLLFSTHNPPYWALKPATGRTVVNSRGVTVTEHEAVIHAGVRVTFYNHVDAAAIGEAVKHAGFQILEAGTANTVVPPTHRLSPDMQEAYEGLVKNNAACPLFFLVLAKRE